MDGEGYITITDVRSFSDFTLEEVDPENVEISFLGGSLRRRVFTGTDIVVNIDTDIRFGYSFKLPAGAVIDTTKSYFYWVAGTNAEVDGGRRVSLTKYETEGGFTYANVVITGVPASAFETNISTRVHLVYTVGTDTTVYEVDFTPEDGTRSVAYVCNGLISGDHPVTWQNYAKFLMNYEQNEYGVTE